MLYILYKSFVCGSNIMLMYINICILFYLKFYSYSVVLIHFHKAKAHNTQNSNYYYDNVWNLLNFIAANNTSHCHGGIYKHILRICNIKIFSNILPLQIRYIICMFNCSCCCKFRYMYRYKTTYISHPTSIFYIYSSIMIINPI